MRKHNNCDGCMIEDCDYYKDNFNGICPCTNCIVKTMCKDDVDACDTWQNWDLKSYQEGKHSVKSPL